MPYIGNPSAQRFTSPRAASVFSGDGSTVAFTLEEAVSTDEDILVSVDGVIQEPSVAYAVSSGTTLTFTAAPSSNSGNNIFVYYIARTLGSVSMPDGQNVNAATLNTSGNVVFNEASADVDFRVESNGNANMLFVEGGTDRVGIGTATLANKLEVDGGSAETRLRVSTTGTDANEAGIILANSSKSADNDGIEISHGGGYTTFSGLTGTEYMRITGGTGIITQPQQPAFSAKAGGSQTNIAVGSSVDVVLGTEIFDQNADFASNTFTAPVTGKYSLNAHFYLGGLDSGADYIQGQITTSNRNYVQVFSLNGFDADFLYMPMTISVVADMDASDTAKLQLYQGGGTQQIDVDGSTYFTGYLLG